MTHSEEFRQFKRLYYQEELPIKTLNIQVSDAESGAKTTVIFEDGESEIEISSTSEDFVKATMTVNKTVREGEEQLVDLSDTPVEDNKGYYENADLFLSDSDDPIGDAVERIMNGEVTPPSDVNLHEALDASLDLDFTNTHLKNVVKSYYECIALQLINLKKYQENFEKHKSRLPITASRVMEYHEIAESILRLEFLTRSAKEGYESYRNYCISDIMFLSTKWKDLRSHNEREWEALHEREGGSVEGSFGLFRLLNEYSSFFELIRDPFIDLASVIEGEKVQDVNDSIEVLTDSEHKKLVEPAVPELRHGPAHFSIEFDDDSGYVKVFDKRARRGNLNKKISYDEALEYYYKMRDLMVAVFYAFVLTEECLVFEYLKSSDFKFRIIENAEAGTI